jgi:hypothetical protein
VGKTTGLYCCLADRQVLIVMPGNGLTAYRRGNLALYLPAGDALPQCRMLQGVSDHLLAHFVMMGR